MPFAFLTALDVLSWRDQGPLRWTVRRGLSIAGVSAAALALFATYGLRPYCLTEYRSFPNQPSRDARLGVSLSLLSSWYHSQPAPSVTYSEGRLRQTLGEMEAALERQETADRSAGLAVRKRTDRKESADGEQEYGAVRRQCL